MTLRYITHPEVVVDPTTPVTEWRLSDLGRARAERMLAQPWVAGISRIVSSGEAKALETAEILAAACGLEVERRDDTGEIDRTVPGFLPPHEFETAADACFAEPFASSGGWETAAAAQARVTAALADLLTAPGDIAVVGHGGVGTLWYCHLAGVPIARRWDQPGQGHYLAVVGGRPVHQWHRVDDIEGV